MAYKEIPLNKGAVTIVDEADYDRLMKFKWRISDKGYAMRTQTDKGKASGILMHRMLLDPQKGFMADHINGDRLDNRRCNLRLANALENARNRANNHNSRSKYKGVAWKVENNKWQARIRIVGKQHHIGLFDTEEDAAYAYNQAAILQHGNFARLNILPKGYAMPEKPKECPLCHRATEPVSSEAPKRIVRKDGQIVGVEPNPNHQPDERTSPMELLKLLGYVNAMIGYCQSLKPGTVITSDYTKRMEDYYIPNVSKACLLIADLVDKAQAPKRESVAPESLTFVTCEIERALGIELERGSFPPFARIKLMNVLAKYMAPTNQIEVGTK